MNPVSFLFQLLPLLVFIVVDAVSNNPLLSIILSIVTAAVQLSFFYLRFRKIDWFIIVDAGLIIGLGALSLYLKNEIFFKMKPAIIDAVALVFFIVFLVSPDQFLIGYFGRMMPGQTRRFNPQMVSIMKKILFWMCIYIVLHGIAVVYAALYSSRTVWAFISGPGFYLFLIPVAVLFIIGKIRSRRSTTTIRPAIFRRKR